MHGTVLPFTQVWVELGTTKADSEDKVSGLQRYVSVANFTLDRYQASATAVKEIKLISYKNYLFTFIKKKQVNKMSITKSCMQLIST